MTPAGASDAGTADAETAKAPPHRPSRRADIVDAAIRVFGREGLAGATVADVAEAAGMAPAAVYYHFSGKEELLAEAVETTRREITQVTSSAAGPVEAMGAAELAQVVRGVFEWADEHPEQAQLFYLWSVGATPEVERIRQRLQDDHVAGSQRLMALRPVPPPYDHELAARAAVAMSVQTSVAWLSQDVFPDGTEREEVIEALARASSRLLLGSSRRRTNRPPY